MSHPRMAEAMRKRWADPEWRARQVKLISEGHKRSQHKPGPTGRVAGPSRHTVWMSDEMHEALVRRSQREKTSVPEVIRMFVEWGLDEEAA